MISSRRELHVYIMEDMEANHFSGVEGFININRRFLKRLRKTEYHFNKTGGGGGIMYLFSKFLLYRLSVKTGILIGINVFGKGLMLPHWGYIVVNPTARFGDYCVVQCGVNISANCRGGNHCYLGTGAKMMIGSQIGNDVIVGANAVVTKKFEENNIVLAGVPAKKISDNGYASGRSEI